MRTRILRVLLFSAAALLSVSLLPAQTLTIYYTASLRGDLDGCACERNRVAGLVKRAAFQRTSPRTPWCWTPGTSWTPPRIRT
jgi:hypothetical protein